MHLKVSKKQINLSKFLRHLPYPTFDTKNRYIDISARLSCSKLEFSTSFNPQNSNSAKLELEKTWKTLITGAKTWNTWAKVELDTCSNSTVWNSIKLELKIKWSHSSANSYPNIVVPFWSYQTSILFKFEVPQYWFSENLKDNTIF